MGWRARFVAQAWINDYAVDVDPGGATGWDLTDAEAAEASSELKRSGDLDYLRDHSGAADWIRAWRGPFYVELLDPDGISV